MQKCGCKKPLLVITDLYMRPQHLNGLETSTQLREVGYGGPIMVRTSQSEDDAAESGTIKSCMKNKVINFWLNKSNQGTFEEVVHNCTKSK